MCEKQLAKEIKRLEKQMLEHAKNLEFEKAAQVRDQLALLRERVFGANVGDHVSGRRLSRVFRLGTRQCAAPCRLMPRIRPASHHSIRSTFLRPP